MELCCGIDIHKESFAGCIMDMNGTLVREHEFPENKDALGWFISGIPNSQMKIAIEACGIWRGVYKTPSELGYDVNWQIRRRRGEREGNGWYTA